MACRRIAVQIHAARRLQYAVHLDDAYRHICEIRCRFLIVRRASGVNHLGERGIVVLYARNPVLMNIILPPPDVAEPPRIVRVRPLYPRLFRVVLAANPPPCQRLRLPLPLRVRQRRAQAARESLVLRKRRVDANQVHALIIQRAQQIQVVGNKQMPVQRMLTLLCHRTYPQSKLQ